MRATRLPRRHDHRGPGAGLSLSRFCIALVGPRTAPNWPLDPQSARLCQRAIRQANNRPAELRQRMVSRPSRATLGPSHPYFRHLDCAAFDRCIRRGLERPAAPGVSSTAIQLKAPSLLPGGVRRGPNRFGQLMNRLECSTNYDR
jgi:hypothetical protein